MSESSTERKEIFPFFRFDALFLSVTIHYEQKLPRRKRKITVFDINIAVLRVPVGILHLHLGIGLDDIFERRIIRIGMNSLMN